MYAFRLVVAVATALFFLNCASHEIARGPSEAQAAVIFTFLVFGFAQIGTVVRKD